MIRQKFLECEYKTLREEIKSIKDRQFKLAGIALIGMPTAYAVAEINNIEVLVMSLPILICAILLLYLSESRALMRCGSYIKEKIEPNVDDNEKVELGWENWLSENDVNGIHDRRAVDKFVTLFFYILFIFYYIASAELAIEAFTLRFNSKGQSFSLGIYSAIGVFLIWFLILNYRKITDTQK